MPDQIQLRGTVKFGGRIQGVSVKHIGKQIWRECKLLIYDGGVDEKGGLSQRDVLELDKMDVDSANIIIELKVSQKPLFTESPKENPDQGDLMDKKKGGKPK